MIQHPRFLKNNIDHLIKQGPPSFFIFSLPVISNVLAHSVEKTHVLVVTVELDSLLLLNILSFNFAQTPNKSLRFKRFRRSYVHHFSVIFQTNQCKVLKICTVFLLEVRCSKLLHSSFFFMLFVPNDSTFA